MAKSTKFQSAAGRAIYLRDARVDSAAVGSDRLAVRLRVDGAAFADHLYGATSNTFRAAFLSRMAGIEQEKRDNLGRYLAGAYR